MKNPKYLISKIIFSLFLILSLCSCATTLHVKVTRPARLDLNGADTIAVFPFKESEKNPFNYFFDSERDFIDDFFNYYIQINSVEGRIIENLHSDLEYGFLNSPYISLVNFKEVKNALKYGYNNPADIFIDGEIISLKVHDYEKRVRREIPGKKPVYEEMYDKNGNPHLIIVEEEVKPDYYYEYYYSRSVQLIFNYQIVDTRNKKIISYDTVNIEQSSDTYDNTRDLPDVYSMVSNDLYSFKEYLLKELQPYTINKAITLLNGDTDDQRMKHADKLANDGFYKESYKEFASIYVDTRQFEAGYNGAMILMALGELRQAEALMNDVYNRYKDTRALDALYDIKEEIKQAKRLENQIHQVDESDYIDFSEEYYF